MAAFYDWSPSSRGRGLKCHSDFEKNQITLVALFTRAWIEISFAVATADVTIVALFTRAWIEIDTVYFANGIIIVALFTRAWIEMFSRYRRLSSVICRPLHEGVD